MTKPKRKRGREPIRFRQGDKVVCLPVERGELPTVCLVVEDQSHGLVHCDPVGWWSDEYVVPLSEYQSEIGYRWRVDDDNARRPIRTRTDPVTTDGDGGGGAA
jgi:hypothetical protein